MRRVFLFLILLTIFPVRVLAAGAEPPMVPEIANEYMPENTENFSEGLFSILGDAFLLLQPAAREAGKSCIAAITTVLLLSLVGSVSPKGNSVRDLIGTLVLGTVLLTSLGTLIRLGKDTVEQISSYGRLLIPVMTGALAAEGGISGSASLYAGTMFFDAVLTTLISEAMIPMLYVANGSNSA